MWVALSSRRRYVQQVCRGSSSERRAWCIRIRAYSTSLWIFVPPAAWSSRRLLALGFLCGRVDVYGESPAGAASDGDGGGGFCSGAGLISRRQAAPVFLLDVVDRGLRI